MKEACPICLDERDEPMPDDAAVVVCLECIPIFDARTADAEERAALDYYESKRDQIAHCRATYGPAQEGWG